MQPRKRFAILGTGFWARYQLAGWRELAGAECVALYNRTLSKAQALANEFGIARVYDDVGALFANEELDFVDIITGVETHSPLVQLAAKQRITSICQKPMAPSLAEAEHMVETCQNAGIPLYIHENWRWQRPIRELKQQLGCAEIGRPFRARVHYCSSFPVFTNQPFLKDLTQFILADMGTHLLDAIRYLFGEVDSLACQVTRVHPDIRGEDVASVMLRMSNGMTVVCEISYASRTEHERFPQTFIHIEGSLGSLELAPDYWLRQTTAAGTIARRVPPHHYAWADPAYDVVHASIVTCNANLLSAIRREGQAETTAGDNLRTLRLVYAAYDAARLNQVVTLR
ncbi:MAG: Gfo/Idh/MocA family protein [Anaerolineae bacterium]